MPGGQIAAFFRAVNARKLLDPHNPPAILVASGTLATRAARRAAARSLQPPALVLIGRHAGSVPEHAGVAVSMQHHGLPPHPHRVTSLLGFGHRDEWQPTVESGKWQAWLQRPRKSALIIGRNPRGNWTIAECQSLLAEAVEWARRRNSRLLIVTTRHSADAGDWLRKHAGDDADVYSWQREDNHNPYGLALEHAGALLIAGGTPGVLQDALASPKPVYLVPWLGRSGAWRRFSAKVAERAFRPSYNKRGSIRPQQGITYICARLVERGWILPPSGLSDWQSELVDRGLAEWIGSSATPSGRHKHEASDVVRQILQRLEPHVGTDARGLAREARF